jgi:hypothetical protein
MRVRLYKCGHIADRRCPPPTVTRSHKANDRDHKGIAEGTALPVENLPRFFAKNGYADVDPKKVKKDGGGKGNWYVTLIHAHIHSDD